MTLPIPDQIFREYDIRGVSDSDLSNDVVVPLGRAIGTYLRELNCKTIAIGQDCRSSSARITSAIKSSLLSTGMDVTEFGLVPTPLLYFGVVSEGLDSGMMVTGSHNPSEYNGLKICVGIQTLFGNQIQEIKRLIHSQIFVSGLGRESSTIINEKYMDTIRNDIRLSRPLKVVVDSGNGVAGLVAPNLYKSLGCQVISIYEEPDGSFPNHHPDPTILENLVDLKERVLREQADVGIAFDGDGDRIGIIDRSGRYIFGDELLVLYARQVLKKNPGAKIISEVKASNRFFNDVKLRGGTPILWKTGHSLIKAKMKEEGALLAGEMSGHMFFRDRYFGFDDAIYAGARLLEILGETGKTPAQQLEDLPPSFVTPEIRIACPDEHKFDVIAKACTQLKKSGFRVNEIDGIRLEFDDGWGIVRASNTQPVLVYRFEATSQARLQEIRTILESVIATFMS